MAIPTEADGLDSRLFSDNPILEAMLHFASGIWASKVERYDETTSTERAQAASDIVAAHGDVLQYARKRFALETGTRDVVGLQVEKNRVGDIDTIEPAPSTGEVFNALAEGMALVRRTRGNNG